MCKGKPQASLLGLFLLFTAVGSPQGLIEYGLGVGAAAKAGSTLNRTSGSLGRTMGRLSQTTRDAAANRTGTPSSTVAPRPAQTRIEAPIELSSSRPVTLFVRWSNAGDVVETIPTETPAGEVGDVAPEIRSAAVSTPESPWEHELLGGDMAQAYARLGKPTLAFTGLGSFGSDARYIFNLADGEQAVLAVRGGIVVRATRKGR